MDKIDKELQEQRETNAKNNREHLEKACRELSRIAPFNSGISKEDSNAMIDAWTTLQGILKRM